MKKSQNNRQNHVQSDENTSKIKLKRCITPFAFGVLSLLANTFQEIFFSKINIKHLLKKETYFWRKTLQISILLNLTPAKKSELYSLSIFHDEMCTSRI